MLRSLSCRRDTCKIMALLQPKKVLITDKIDAVCKSVFEKNGIEVDLKPGMPKDEILVKVKDYDCLIVRSATKVTADVIETGEKLQLIGRAGTGVDNIDIDAASKNGVFVMNTPGGNTLSAAEHTCALISALARNIGQGHASLKQGKWERSKLMGCELNGKTLAILGLGRIGKEVAFRMQSYGMKTIGFDPVVSKEEAAEFGIESLPLAEIWPQADFITVHTPLIPQTRGLLSKPTFELCKDGLRVVNVARGGIIDESDLIDALDSGKVAGAALDVFVSEPPSETSEKLVLHPKVLCTPHLGASTVEAQKRVALEIAQQIVDGSEGKPMVGLVNAPFLSAASDPKLKCWFDLSQKLAMLLSSRCGGANVLHVEATGDLLRSAKGLASAGIAYGYLKHGNKDVNIINSLQLLKAAGTEIRWTHADSNKGDFPATLTITAESPTGKSMLLGTVFESTTPVLLQLDGQSLSVPVSLDRHLFMYPCSNQASFFKMAGERNFNIANFVSAKCAQGIVVLGEFADDKEIPMADDLKVVLF